MCSHHMQVTKTNQLALMDDIKQHLLFTAFSMSTGPNKAHDSPKRTGWGNLELELIKNILSVPFLNRKLIETEFQHTGSRYLQTETTQGK